MSWRERLLLILILWGPAAALAVGVGWRAQDGAGSGDNPPERPFVVQARKYAFEPSRIEVAEGDLVKIELHTPDIAHSFTIDDYRISKRVSPDQPVSFEFR